MEMYEAQKSNLVGSSENNSGQGKGIILPEGVRGWSWGAFLLNWIWAIGNRTWVGLFAIVPYVGFVVAIVLGIKGREWAWQNKEWESVEQFLAVQKKWAFWGVVLLVVPAILGILAAIIIPQILANRP
jgi:hypothetical protein